MVDIYGLSQTTAPTEEPITVDDAKLHCRIDEDADNLEIARLIRAARELVESETSRQLATATYTLKLDRFPCGGRPIRPPRPPLQSVTSITYLDSGGVSTTWDSSNYIVDTSVEPGRISLAYNAFYPTYRIQSFPITIVYVAGYGAATAVPEGIKHAMRLLIGNWYENRESSISGTIIGEVPLAFERLLSNYRLPEAA